MISYTNEAIIYNHLYSTESKILFNQSINDIILPNKNI